MSPAAAAALAALVCLAPAARAQETSMPDTYRDLKFPPLPKFSPAQPSLTELPNGLRVYLMEDHELPLVTIRALIRGGAAYEPPEKVGLASVVASSMRTGGTKSVPGDALDDELGALAATIDVSFGSLTGGASGTALAEKLPRVLELFADVLRRPAFPEEKIELARSLLRTGISRRNDQIGQMAARAFQIAMYGKASPFAREPEYATVNAISRDDVVRFHDKHVRADRASIGIVGDFDSTKVLAQIRTLFGDWAKAEEPLRKIETDPIALESTRVFYAEKLDVNQTNLFLGAPGVRRDDPDWPALRVGSFVLGTGGFSNRLLKKVRTELGLAYSVGGGFSAEYERLGTFRTLCQTKTGSTATAISAILGEIEGILTSPPTDVEVANAKEQIQNAEIFDYDSRAEVLGRRMTLDYHGYPPDHLERTMARIRAVTAAEVHAALRRHLAPKKLAIVAVGKAAGFDRPLSEFGPVTTLDLSIPEPGVPGSAPATAEAKEAGLALAERVLAAHGGRAAWASLRTSRLVGETSFGVAGSATRATASLERVVEFPSRSFVVATFPQLTVSRGIDGDVAWEKRNDVVTTPPASMAGRYRAMFARELDSLLRRVARGELIPLSSAPNALDLLDDGGRLAELAVDAATGRVASMRAEGLQGPITRAFADYREVGGFWIPFRVETTDGQSNPVVTLSTAELNGRVDPRVFAAPADSSADAASKPASSPRG